ncbi:MAG TPA: sulfite dehydrogenase [Archangium sp.]|jgi:sulfane dehydrogenase subunit SoxC|uniref:sulfite dehydrogenase n=1 Tax=Archangium sp. TaxID=1872627 RepID=UPI002ED7B0B3
MRVKAGTEAREGELTQSSATGPRGRIQSAAEQVLTPVELSRRKFFGKALVAIGAAAAAGTATVSAAETAKQAVREALDKNLPPAVPEWNRILGAPILTQPYGLPSAYEKNIRRRESPGLTRTPHASVSFTPLQNLFGIITPSGLHFERHHAGMPGVDPHQHRLMIHGLVERPLLLSMEDLLRLPSVSRIHFIECGANTGMEWANVAVPTVQYTHGMLACSEWTGVPLAVLLEEAGYDARKARFILAEGSDGAGLTRTIPIELALDDVLVAYGQNGEMLRPENGYPLRLLVPGVQGVSSVKWLRRLEVGDQPWNTREESLHYVDLLPDGLHRQYTWIQEAKSVITSPSGGQVLLDKGYYEITGLAWSGRGRVKRVDVSTDGGRNWRTARLQEPVLPKALTRFRIDWRWEGSPALLQSRVMDETGYVQPKLAQLRAVRGGKSIYHNNGIQTWRVAESGDVSNVQVD